MKFILLLCLVQILAAAPDVMAQRKAARDSLLKVLKQKPQAKNSLGVKPVEVPVSQDSTKLQSTSLSEVETPVIKPKSIELPIADSLIIESLNVRQTDIRDLIQGMAVQFGLNIYMSPEVSGLVSVNFNNIPVKEALKILVEENHFSFDVSSSTIKVIKPKKVIVAKPKPKIQDFVSYENKKLSLDIKEIELTSIVRKIVDKTSKVVVLERNAKGKVSAFFKNLPFDRGIRLFAQTNDLLVKEREGIYTIYKQSWGDNKKGSRGRMWVKVTDTLISLEVNEAPLKAVIASISEQAGINTVVYGKLTGNVTAKLKDISLEKSFQYLFRDSDFTFWVQNGIYFLGPQRMQTTNNSRLIKMKYMKAEDLVEILPASLKESANINIVKGQNAVMILASYEKIDAISDYIQKVDLPVPMILIEALVVDLDLDKVRDYGLNLFLGTPKANGPQEAIYPAINQVFNKDQAQSFLDGLPGLKDVISLPKSFAGQIRALEQEKALKVRSKPQIATLNGETATITVGQTQYFLLKTETDFNQNNSLTNRTTERFEKIEANVTLTVTPFVTGEGEITCEIIPDFSEPEGSFDSSLPPTLNRRHLQSKVKLRDGETIILGGLVKESRQEVHNQLPFLGSIPIVGWLFKNVSYVDSRSQLMIFVTPHIYYGSDAHVSVDKVLESIE